MRWQLLRTLVCVASSAACPASAAPLLSTLASFDGANGSDPVAEPTIDFAGNLYGTTSRGGPGDGGTIYELSGPGHRTLTTVASFGGSSGSVVTGPLTLDLFNNLYGTTSGGTSGGGTAFRLSGPDHRSVATLARFGAPNGTDPVGLTFDLDVLPTFPFLSIDLFGATYEGGSGSAGTLFELAGPNFNTIATVHSFTLGKNSFYPNTRLVADGAGNLFGTSTGILFSSSVFELSGPTHRTFRVLTQFGLEKDGSALLGGLAADAAGNLYGTAAFGGPLFGGTIYELPAPDHSTISNLFNFDENGTGGRVPESTLLLDAVGNLYGTTSMGGSSGDGTVFRLSADHRTMTILHSFSGSDGSAPVGGLAADLAGNLYGTTSAGGAGGAGTVFELSGAGFVTTR